jgi:archaellum component FlaC
MSAKKIPEQAKPSPEIEQDAVLILDKSNTPPVDKQNSSGNVMEHEEKIPGLLIDLPEPETKLLSARDINAKMAELELHFETLTRDFSEAQGDLAATVRSLRSRNARLNKEIEKVETNASQSADRQLKLSELFERRIQGKLDSLSGGLIDANEFMAEQTRQLARLETVQAAFEEMQDRLEKRTNELDDELKNQVESSSQRITANKAHIEALNALHQDQKSSLMMLSEDHDSLKDQVGELADKVVNMELDVARHQRTTYRRFKIVAGVVTGITLTLASALVWFTLNPTAAPKFLTNELNRLNGSVTELQAQTAEQVEARTQLMSDIASLKKQFSMLEAKAASLHGQNSNERAVLQAQVKNTSTELTHLKATLAAIKKGMSDLKFEVQGPGNENGMVVKSLLPLKGAAWVAQRNPDHYSIQLVGAYEKNHLVAYVNQNEKALKGSLLSYNKSRHIKRSWYNLYYGNYATFSSAQAALTNLPLRLKTNYPWVRSYGAIQKGAVK